MGPSKVAHWSEARRGENIRAIVGVLVSWRHPLCGWRWPQSRKPIGIKEVGWKRISSREEVGLREHLYHLHGGKDGEAQ